jgi:hypothetical protein
MSAGIITQAKQPDVDSILRFMRTLNPLRPSAAGDGKEKVTGGLSGLSPGDRLAVETFHRKRAHTDFAVADKAQKDAELLKDGERDATSLEEQIGTPYHSSDIIKRLHRLNYNFVFERSNAFPDIMGIYWPDAYAEMRNGRRLRHIMGFEFGFSPEFSVWHPEAKGPKKVTRGWRSLILQLSRKGYLNLNAACNAFSIEVYSQSSERWRRELGLDKIT